MIEIKPGSKLEVDGRIGIVQEIIRRKSPIDGKGKRSYVTTVKGTDWKKTVTIRIDCKKYKVTTGAKHGVQP